MKPDIQTLVLALIVINILQTLAFILHYLTDRKSRGTRQWLLWSVCSAAGYIVLYVRPYCAGFSLASLIVLTNALLFGGQLFLYYGIMRFLRIGSYRPSLSILTVLFLLGTAWSTHMLGSGDISGIVLYLSEAALAFLAGYNLWRKSGEAIRISARFLAALFFFQTLSQVFFTAAALASFPALAAFASMNLQDVFFLVQFCMGYLWAFFLVIMINHAKIAEAREARENQELIFNTLPDAVWVTDVEDNRILDINEGFTRLTGYDRDMAIARTSMDLNLWEDIDERSRILECIKSSGFYEDYEAVFRRMDGSLRNGIVSSKLLSLQGSLRLVNFIRDITLRKEMEVTLRKNEEKFRMLVENNYDIIYTMNVSGNFTFVSPVWTRLLGHEIYEVVGKAYKDFIHPEDFPACRQFLEKVVNTGERQSGIEYRVRHKSGEWLWHTSSIVPFHDEAGKVSSFYGIDRDIMELRRVQRDLEYQATTDEMTGITNRRHFLQLASCEVKRALRLDRPLALALIDIDYFKTINDSWGHAVGDQALMFFTQLLHAHVREIDILARFGGDEFVLLLPETSLGNASEVLGRLEKTLSENPFTVPQTPIYLSVSAGLTGLVIGRDSEDSLDTLLVRADKALYRSKEAGRKRYSVI